MDGSESRPASRSRRPSRRAVVVMIVAVVVVFVAVVATLELTPPAATKSPPVIPGTTVLENATGPAVALEGGFLGVNVRADITTLTSTSTNALTSTPVRLVRWPGGALADRLAMLADGGQGLVYQDNGSSSPAVVLLASFADWCHTFQCQAVITLPGEIDDPAYAAEIVSYSVSTLGFVPTYWEIGNEPALWTHFGVPWANWTTGQDLSVTAEQYAHVVQGYVTAIRSVDPSARFLGLPGVGKGGAYDATWITDTVQLNGPNLSAVAIHVYPMGSLSGSTSLADWFGSVNGSDGLPTRVVTADTAIHAACPSCSISLITDEFGTGTNITSQDGLTGGHLAAYIAAMIVQGLSLPLSSLDYYVFQAGTYGAWFDTSGQASPSFDLYEGLSQYLGAYAAPAAVHATAGGLWAALGGPNASALDDVLLVNTNASTTFWVNLSSTFPAANGGTAWTWDGPAATPSVGSIGTAGAVNWTVPPASLVMLSGLGARDPVRHSAPPPLAAGLPHATRAPLPTLPDTAMLAAEPPRRESGR